jgi:hypothetical protein
MSAPVVAWLGSDEAGHASRQVLRAIGETLILMDGWKYGPTLENGRVRWDASKLGAQIGAHLFRTRAPGLQV